MDMHDAWAHCRECDGYSLKAELRKVRSNGRVIYLCDGCYWAADDE